MSRPLSLLAAVCVLIAGIGLPARGQGSDPEPEGEDAEDAIPSGGPAEGYGPPQPDTPSRSRSVGRTNRGRLLRGVLFETSPTAHAKNDATRYGTQEFVNLLTWAIAQVDEAAPGSRFLLGDISRQRGGRLRPHRSHRVGRDADVGFYLLDSEGEPAMNNRFIPLRRNGTGNDRRAQRELKFDDVRNWHLIAALMGQDVVPVQYIMVISPLKERLLAEGARQGAPAWLLHRVREAVGPRRTGRGRAARYGTHNSHFHIRIYCDQDDRPRCVDSPPYWDWIHRPPPPRATRRTRRRRRGSMRGSMRVSMRSRSRMRSSRMRSSRMRSSRMRASRMRASRMR